MRRTDDDWINIFKDVYPGMSDAAIAIALGCTILAVQQARKKVGVAPSPEQRGGDRKSLDEADDEMTTAVINCSKGAKRSWMTAKGSRKWDEWAIEVLNAAANYQPSER